MLIVSQLDRKGGKDITVSRLRETGVDMEAPAAVSRGIQLTCTRTCLPFLYDERDFISYGEVSHLASLCFGMFWEKEWKSPKDLQSLLFIISPQAARYIVLKDHTMFVYTEENDPVPLYTLPLSHLKPILEDRENPHKASLTISPEPNTNLPNPNMDSVLLVDGKGSLVYQVTFDKSLAGNDAAGQFVTIVQNSNLTAKSQEKEMYK